MAFRVDASLTIGIGHLMRCLALSEELKRRGNCCHIISKIDNSVFHNKIKNLNLKQLKTNITVSEEIETLIKYSKKNNIDWIITDHYKIDTPYNRIVKQNGFNLLSIDDNSQIHYYSDIVLNQNFGSEKLEFSSEKYTKFLLGHRYVLIRDELLNNFTKKRYSNVKKILISLGGSDFDNYTLKILKSLTTIDENIEFMVVIAPLNPYSNEIKKYIKNMNRNVILILDPKEMSKIYLESDLAISSGGSSCYELAYYGIPNLIISVAENQLNVANEIEKLNMGIYIGRKNEFKTRKLLNGINELIDNLNLRKSMSHNGKKIIDGRGKERVVDFLEKYN